MILKFLISLLILIITNKCDVNARASPYSPNYLPECALIVQQTKSLHHHHPKPSEYLSPGLRYATKYTSRAKRASYLLDNRNICITYFDIDKAILKATSATGNYVPNEIFKLSADYPNVEHVAVPAEILQYATKLLANKFNLSKSTIYYGLTKIDTSKTKIKEVCPTFLRPVKCELSKYRTLTGMCNNLNNPSWGSARSAMLRYLPPAYSDGVEKPKVAHNKGYSLPNPRVVSYVVHHDLSARDHHITTLVVAWGQMVDHDMTLGNSKTDEVGQDMHCCDRPIPLRDPHCIPIEIPKNDPFYKYFKRTCMDVLRLSAGLLPGCKLGPRSPINIISSFIDGGFIYGSTQEVANRLRTFKNGQMKTTKIYQGLGFKDILPMKTVEADLGCERKGKSRGIYCFDAGDERVNEQLTLTIMHTLWMREHNRIASYLCASNPHYSDEKIYQEARRIVIASVQHITFNEFLPIILGEQVMLKYGLNLVKHGYYGGYDTKLNPGIKLAFQSAAFRFGHSILPDVTERYNKFHQKLESIRLSKLLRQPYELYKPGIVDSFVHGLIDQEANRMDPEITTEVTNHLFQRPGEHFGLDLASINIQRGREVGLPGYNAYREYCGLPRIHSFDELYGFMDNETISRYKTIYRHVEDIDLWSAGVSEYPLKGALLGPTFTCLIAEQFSLVKNGDRFWYENAGWPSEFTPEQLSEIRKMRAAKFLCQNSDDMETIQLNPFLQADLITNPRVSCHELPKVDLSVFNDLNYYEIIDKKKK